MKLIIDIPDKDYEKLKDGHIPFSILDVMQDGIPLDKIKAEIEEVLNEPEYQHEGENWGAGLCIAQEIIDKYRESEG